MISKFQSVVITVTGKTFFCSSLREVLLDVVQHVLALPVDLFMLLHEGVLRVQRPGHHILLSARSHHLASDDQMTSASSLCCSETH